MKSYRYGSCVCLAVLLLCIVSESHAQTPSIISVSQKEISDAQGDRIQLSFLVSSPTDEMELTKATFSDLVTTDASINKNLITLNKPLSVNTDKMILVSIPFGDSKAIQPKATLATFAFSPKAQGIAGSPYTITFVGSDLANVFQNLHKAIDTDALSKKVSDQEKEIARLVKLLPQPKLEWNVVEGFRKLRFEATTTKKDGATISVNFKCDGKDALNERFVTPEAPVSIDSTFQTDITCDVAVSEKQPPQEVTDRLLISSTQGRSSFTTLKNDNIALLESNTAKQDKALSQTRVFVPLKLSAVSKVEADLFKIIPGKPIEKVNTKEPVKGTLKSCAGVISQTADRCQEDVTFEVPTMEFGTKYRLILRGFSDNPLRDAAMLSREFDSLPETFTKSILITFTEKGMRFTALTGDVEAELTIAPEWANSTAALPFQLQTSKKSKDPFQEVSPAEWLAAISSQELGSSGTAATTPAPKQLKIGFVVSAKDGTDRVSKSSVSFSLDKPAQKKSNDLKNFVTKAAKSMLGQSSSGDPKLSFATVGGAIASLIGLFVGL